MAPYKPIPSAKIVPPHLYPVHKGSGFIQPGSVQGTMPVRGMNLKDDSQLLNSQSALKIDNYLVYGVAKMQKRPGQIIDFNTSETTPIPLSDRYRNNYDIVAYGSKVRAYNTVTQSFTDIKTNFIGTSGWTGSRYGDYYFVNNFTDGLWRISQTLAYNAETASFTVGKTITGATSGATAVILEIADTNPTGTLTLGQITPNPTTGASFANGEIISDNNGSPGSATTNGVVTFAITSVTGAPKARIFRIIASGNSSARGILVGLITDEAGYNYSSADTGTNPPFTNWTPGTGFNDPGAGSNRNGGIATDCALIGDIVFVGQQKGWYAFKIDSVDLLGVSSKKDIPISYREDWPVYKCVTTNVGMIVASNSGLSRLKSLGQPNIPYSDQWESLTDDLGPDFFNDVNFSNTDIAYDSQRGFIYCTVGKNSATNNLVLAISSAVSGKKTSVKNGATSTLTGWNVLQFMQDGNLIYGTSALTGIRHQLFVGQKDVQAKIHSTYRQELNFGLNGVFIAEDFLAKGDLSPASNITISFDTFNFFNVYEKRVRAYSWPAPSANVPGPGGWGQAGFGNSGWANGASVSGLIPSKTGRSVKLRERTRIILNIESDDYAEHILSFFTMDVTTIKQARVRTLQ